MSDELIFLTVLLLRLFVPLLIIRFPLPAIIAALVLDAADQTIFQNNTDLELTNYQGYDKALDVYYLAIAYLSTFRNWRDPFAARIAQTLWYYRLLGVVLFELTEVRALLIIFPNTFEYFFIAYEAVRLLWNPARLAHRHVLGMAIGIWIFVKLPQEYWIHIAQLDFTDFMKEDVFGVTTDTSWGSAIGDNLWFVGLVVVVAGAAYVLLRRGLAAAPPPDWSLTIDVDSNPEATSIGVAPIRPALWSWDLVEKFALLTMITIIFAQVLPGTDASPLQLAWAVGLFVVANGAVTQWLSARGSEWQSILVEFLIMSVINAGIALGWILLLRQSDQPVSEGAIIFFVLLLTEIIVLFDRYRPIRSSSFPARDLVSAGTS